MNDKPEEMNTTEQQAVVEQIPSVVKSHLPAHLQPRSKKPLEASKGVNGTDHASTPAIIKRRQIHKWMTVNSPTDAFLSPCTQKLMKPKHDSQVIQPLSFDGPENEEQLSVPNNS